MNESFDEGFERKKDLIDMDAIDMELARMKTYRSAIAIEEAYLTRLEASHWMGISLIDFDQLMKWPSFPFPIWNEGNIPRWRQSDLEWWMEWNSEDQKERIAYEALGKDIDSETPKGMLN